MAGIAGGLIALAVVGGPELGETPPVRDDDGALVSIEDRLTDLEQQVADFETAVASGAAREEPRNMPSEGPGVTADTSTASESSNPEDRFFDRMQGRTSRINTRLREFGWTDAEIDALEQLRIKARLEAEERMFHQTRAMAEKHPGLMEGYSALREGLREEKYEEYLRAAGNKRLAAPVRYVLEGSAGDAAGLQAGDLIRRYGTERIYGDQDLTLAMLQGEYGEPVTIEVERDGTIFYLTVPRGPLGTTGISSMMIQ